MAEFNGTPHNSAKVGDIAKTVLMPGDPLRAQYIAENFLENPKEFNHVRGMLGYTGTYKGVPVSVMGSGMGMPSIGIYSYELYNFYGVENIIRVGSCGGFLPEMKLFDLILADSAFARSSYAKVAYGYEEDLMYPAEELNVALANAAEKLNKHVYRGVIFSSDCFYSNPEVQKPAPYDVIGVEMEAFALFANARYLGKNAAVLLTISDKAGEETTAEERQTAFRDMMEVALEAAITL